MSLITAVSAYDLINVHFMKNSVLSETEKVDYIVANSPDV